MALILLAALACRTDELPVETPDAEAPVADVVIEEMSAVDLLTRASLDLRGVRPTVAEIEAVEADPDAVEDYIDAFLVDERFPAQVRAWYANILLTRQDTWTVTAAQYGIDDNPGFAASIGEESLWIVSTVADEDLPWTELVTGDWTMANEVTSQVFQTDYPQGETGWKRVHYTDGRPNVGVLSATSLWWRYMSNASNGNRGRANAVSKMLLCTDYLTKPIEFERDVNLLDANAVNDALQNNPGCVACHYSLDPLASYLWGFFFIDYRDPTDISQFHPEREYYWQTYGDIEPAYFGEPGYQMEDLGVQIAADPRFPTCAVEQVWETLLQRDSVLDDTTALTEHRQAFINDGLVFRSLVRSVMDSPEYRAAPIDDDRYASAKLVGTDQLASSIEDLTGFRFTYADYDMMQTDTYGLRTLAGGVDGNFVTSPAREPMTTMVLVQERLAQGAAAYVVDQDGRTDVEPTLFLYVTFGETPATDLDAMVEQIQHLHLRLFSHRVDADGPEVEANLALWEDLYAIDGDAEAAWAGVLSVLLRDPDFLIY